MWVSRMVSSTPTSFALPSVLAAPRQANRDFRKQYFHHARGLSRFASYLCASRHISLGSRAGDTHPRAGIAHPSACRDCLCPKSLPTVVDQRSHMGVDSG
jgi:hypothetical protein